MSGDKSGSGGGDHGATYHRFLSVRPVAYAVNDISVQRQIKKSRINILTVLCCMFLVCLAWTQPIRAETTTYYVTNAQGTVVAEMDTVSNVTYNATYRPYGKQQNGMAQPGPGYAGHVNDPATGFVYMKARYYDPEVGRFLSIDPVSFSSGNIYNFNAYDYVYNNPVLNTDPTGREAPCISLNINCIPTSNRGWRGQAITMLLAAGVVTGAIFGPEIVMAGSGKPVGRVIISLGSLVGSHPGAVNQLVRFDPEGQVAETVALLDDSAYKMKLELEILSTATNQEKSMILAALISTSKNNSSQSSYGKAPYIIKSVHSDTKEDYYNNGNRFMPSSDSPNFYYDRKQKKWRRVPINQHQ